MSPQPSTSSCERSDRQRPRAAIVPATQPPNAAAPFVRLVAHRFAVVLVAQVWAGESHPATIGALAAGDVIAGPRNTTNDWSGPLAVARASPWVPVGPHVVRDAIGGDVGEHARTLVATTDCGPGGAEHRGVGRGSDDGDDDDDDLPPPSPDPPSLRRRSRADVLRRPRMLGVDRSGRSSCNGHGVPPGRVWSGL